MNKYRYVAMTLSVFLSLALMLPVAAQMGDETSIPAVEVADQVSLDGTVTIASAFSAGPGFIVIHRDSGEGRPGPVIGHRSINAGWSFNIGVEIDAAQATPTLFAMLHEDTGTVGTYEFGAVEGADLPVRVKEQVVTPSFNVDVINAQDQFVDNATVTIASTTTQVDGWLVIHADNGNGGPGPVLGAAAVQAGITPDVVVNLNGDATDVLWPMLHVDTGAAGEYEFGTVEGADRPVVVGGTVAVTPIWTVPHVRVADQIVLHGDGMEMMDMTPTVLAESVLAEGPAFLVIHSESAEGGPGPVAGVSDALPPGLSTDLTIELDPALVTPNLWPMLHVDTGAAGEYEFGTVEGADLPVRVNEQVVTFGISASPSLTMVDGPLVEAMMGLGPHIIIDEALIDAHGWIAIHSSADGRPGPVIGTAPLVQGMNKRVVVELAPEDAGDQVFPMLHYDTGVAGTYEFGTVEGADGPVAVAGNVVVGPLNIVGAAEDMGEALADDCTITTTRSGGVNLRGGPGTNFAVQGNLAAGQTAPVDGQAQGADGFVWWHITDGNWARSDVVDGSGDCEGVPALQAPAPPQAPAPAATEEASS